MAALQCARVDNFPRIRGRDPNLPNIQEGSGTAACVLCRQQVWVSSPARKLITSLQAEPVCDECHPALPVSVTPGL